MFLCIIRPSSPRREEKGTDKRPRQNGARVKAIASDIIAASKQAGELLTAPDLLARSQLKYVVLEDLFMSLKLNGFNVDALKKLCHEITL